MNEMEIERNERNNLTNLASRLGLDLNRLNNYFPAPISLPSNNPINKNLRIPLKEKQAMKSFKISIPEILIWEIFRNGSGYKVENGHITKIRHFDISKLINDPDSRNINASRNIANRRTQYIVNRRTQNERLRNFIRNVGIRARASEISPINNINHPYSQCRMDQNPIEFKKLKKIHKSIGDLKYLVEINFSNNNLTKLPVSIGKLGSRKK